MRFARPSRHKYNAQETFVEGHKFDSKLEARRYQQLKLLVGTGTISDLELQPEFELQPGFIRDGKRHRPIMYRADFSYVEGGRRVIEEVKGHQTAVWRLKQKLFLSRYPALELRVLTKEDI